MDGIEIHDLGPQYPFGARVRGITRANAGDETLRRRMQDLFVERGLIVFEDMEPTPEMQLALSTMFGPLKDHPTKSTPRADPELDPGVIDMKHKHEAEYKDHGLTEVDGKKVISFLPWHFDHTYNDELNYAGVLRAIDIAPEGGRTGFADGIQIYRNLDPAIRAKIDDVSAIYTLDVRLSQMRFGRYFETHGDLPYMAGVVAESARFPRAIHPMVWTRPSGEKVAHYCGFSAVGLENHEDPEGEAMFEEALQAMYKVLVPYWHEWKTTDMLIWDNHRLLHAVEGCDPRYERRMHRTTIKGDYGLGRFEGGKKIGEVQREVAPMDLPA